MAIEDSLSLDNILGVDDIDNLFEDDNETQETPPEEKEKDDKEKETTEVIDPENLFGEDKPESVGSKENKGKEESTSSVEDETSPNNFFSSIASALKEDGAFPDLEDSDIEGVKTPEDFRALIDKLIESKLDEIQKRVNKALDSGVEPDAIKSYENTISNLNRITEESISDEGDEGQRLRKTLILQDYINRGFSPERALKEFDKSILAGTEIEDAKDALKSNKDFFQNSYNELLKKAEEEDKELQDKIKKLSEELKKSILEDKNVFGDIELDKDTRKKIYDNISKPIYKNNDGVYMTAIQKYQEENPSEFLKKLGVIFTLTDGFKSLDNFVKGKVNKEVKKGLRDLERTLNNTSRASDGNLKFVGNIKDDPESYFGKGLRLDI